MPKRQKNPDRKKAGNRRYPIVEIEDVQEPFCGVRRKNLVPLSDANPEIADEWLYSRNEGWGPEHFSRASGVKCWWKCQWCNREYKAQINNRTKRGSACPYCASKKVCSDNSLAENQPGIAAEWHPTKNGRLTPSGITRASSRRVWWQCRKCKYAWECAVADRTTLHSGCPACYEARMEYAREHPKPYVRKRIVLGEETNTISREWYQKPSSKEFVSLAEFSPAIAKQWHPTKNGKWKPSDFSKGSDVTAWWKCKKGADHEWPAPIYSRTGRNSGCPFCNGKFTSRTNSLASLFPDIAKEWHRKRNGDLKPADVTGGSAQAVWWQCSRNRKHEWRAKVTARTTNGNGCPYCTHKKLDPNNSLQSLFPHIAVQLHPEKNHNLDASELAAFSSKRAWWKCDVGPDHEWEAVISNRTNRGSNCPYCDHKRVSVTNSLATIFPKIAKQWDKKRNQDLTPSDVFATSKQIVFWQCKRGHTWHQSISGRTKSTVECWQCLGQNPTGVPPKRPKNR